MTDNDQTNKIDLTRRKILGSLGAVGAAGAGAGLGTSALFSDEEGFANNILEAGEFDLKVDWEVDYYNGLAPDPETISDSDTDDDGDLELVDDPGPIVDLQDVKPGDVIEHTLSLHLFGNPGFITMDGLITADSDAGFTEPEDQVDGALDNADGTPDGDLDDHLQCVAWYDGGTNNTDPGNNFPEEITDYTPVQRDTFIDDLIDGDVSFDTTANEFILQGTFSNVMAALSGGLLLDPQVNGNVAGSYPGSQCFEPSTTQYIGVLCWLPRDIPGVDDNILQSDRLEYRLGFNANQCRNNIANNGRPDQRPTGGVQPLTFEVTEGFGTLDGGPFDLQSDVGFPENMITSVDTSGDPVEFVLDVPEELDKSAGDQWSLVFDADDDGTVDFRVVFDEFFYQDWDGDGWGSRDPVPADIDTGVVDGIYIVRVPRDRLSDPFAFAGRLCYDDQAPTGENLCISLIPELNPMTQLGPGTDDFKQVTLGVDDDDEPPSLVGKVSADDGTPITGATVTALLDGVRPMVEVTTDDEGEYKMSVLDEGTYDVRAVADGRVPSTVVDIEIEAPPQSESTRADIVLTDLETAFEEAGRDPVMAIDSDRDGLPDAFEEAIGTDPNEPDTSGDGVPDGVANLVGADPLVAGPGDVPTAAPDLRRPSPDETHPASADGVAPIGLVFDPVPGATGYTVTLHPGETTDEDPILETDLDFLEGDLIIGELAVGTVVVENDLVPGKYTLAISGFYGTPTTPVGETTTRSITVSVEDSETGENLCEEGEVVLEDGDTVEGLVCGESIRVEGAVSAHDDVRIVALGQSGITIEADASLSSEGGTTGDIELYSGGDVRIEGSIEGGAGNDGESNAETNTEDGVTVVKGKSGADGGAVRIFAAGAIEVLPGSVVSSGDGGSGGEATATGQDGPEDGPGDGEDALADAGDGGSGGDLIMVGDKLRVADRPDLLVVGRGGAGGDATATGGDASSDGGVGGVGTPDPGAGGNGGDLSIGPGGFFGFANENLGGGGGGDAGDGQTEAGESSSPANDDGTDSPSELQEDCECPPSSSGKDHEPPTGKDGGDGWINPGRGGDQRAEGANGSGCGRGGHAEAEAGDGGDIKKIGGSIGVFGAHYNMVTTAGDGGLASANAGDGGEAGDGGAGDAQGGDATATGGDGGDGPTAVGPDTHGGDGGDAYAFGGDAKDADPCCDPPGEALSGGNGGNASAEGGDGGDGNNSGGDGGKATALGGDAGDGGDGCPPGVGGDKGNGDAVGGTQGTGNIVNGSNGEETDSDGNDGDKGEECCPESPGDDEGTAG